MSRSLHRVLLSPAACTQRITRKTEIQAPVNEFLISRCASCQRSYRRILTGAPHWPSLRFLTVDFILAVQMYALKFLFKARLSELRLQMELQNKQPRNIVFFSFLQISDSVRKVFSRTWTSFLSRYRFTIKLSNYYQLKVYFIFFGTSPHSIAQMIIFHWIIKSVIRRVTRAPASSALDAIARTRVASIKETLPLFFSIFLRLSELYRLGRVGQ